MPHSTYKKIGCIANLSSGLACKAHKTLIHKYKLIDLNENDEKCDAVVAIGGDGLMLKVLHRFMYSNTPIFGMNRGSIGFLMNNYSEEHLLQRLTKAEAIKLHPLEMVVETADHEIISHLAVNEVSLLRQTNQSAKLKITVNNKERLDELVCDGIMISTTAGSTAYNFAANGPILPLTSNLLAMTPICPFRPRRWKGALLSNDSSVRFDILNYKKRPVSATADFHEVRDIRNVVIQERGDVSLTLLFDKDNSLQDRLIKEQFLA